MSASGSSRHENPPRRFGTAATAGPSNILFVQHMTCWSHPASVFTGFSKETGDQAQRTRPKNGTNNCHLLLYHRFSWNRAYLLNGPDV